MLTPCSFKQVNRTHDYLRLFQLRKLQNFRTDQFLELEVSIEIGFNKLYGIHIK